MPDYLVGELPQFTGREWVFESLADWVDTTSSKFLLVGQPGAGKSLLAAQLVQRASDVYSARRIGSFSTGGFAVAHFCRALDTAALDPLRLVEALAAHFAGCVGDPYVRALTEAAGRETRVTGSAVVQTAAAGAEVTGVRISVREASPVVAFERFVRQPLASAMSARSLEPAIVLVDALDESLTWPSDENIVRLVQAILETNLPLRFLLTSRRDARVERMLGRPDLDLGADAPADVDDVGDYAARRLADRPERVRLLVAEKIAAAAEGNFLYARYVLDDLAEDSQLDPATLELPEGLPGHYRSFIGRELAPSRERWEDRYRPLLGAVAVARGAGLTARQLAASTGLPLSATEDGLLVMSQYLAGPRPTGPFRLFHHSFRDFLFSDADYRVYPSEANEAVAVSLRPAGEWIAADDYAVENMPMHVVEALRTGVAAMPNRESLRRSLSGILGDFAFLEEKTARFGIATLLADARAAVDVAPGEEMLEAILRVLDLEAHDLTDWNRDDLPQFLAQQALTRAEALAELSTAAAARERLAELRRPYLCVRWRSGEESSAVLRTLRNRGIGFLAVAVAADGATAASGSEDGSLILWDLSSGRRLRTLSGHRSAVTSVAFSEDGQWLLSGSEDGTVKLWDAQSGAEGVSLEGHTSRVSAVSFVGAHTAHVLSSSADKTLRLWETRTGTAVRVFEGHGSVTSIAVSSDGFHALSGSWDHTVRMWDLRAGTQSVLLDSHPDGVLAVCISRDGRYGISGAWDGTLRFHDLARPDLPAAKAEAATAVWSIAAAEDGRVIAALDDGTLEVWRIEPLGRVGILSGHGFPVRGVAVTPDGRRAVTASEDETLMVWDLAAPIDDALRRGHATGVERAVVSPDGARAASSSNDGLVRVWEVKTGEPLWERRFTPYRAEALAISRDSSRLLLTRSAGVKDHRSLEIFSLNSGQPVDIVSAVFGSTVCLDESRLVGCTWDLKLNVFDLPTRELIRSWDLTPAEWPKSVAITPDGRLVVAAFDSGARASWDVETGESHVARASAGWASEIAVAVDGRRAVTSLSEGLELWDLAAGTFETRPQSDGVVAVATVGSSRALAVNRDGTVALWGLDPLQRLAVAPVEVALECVASSPDGSTILTGDEWGNVHLLRLVAPP